VTAAVQWRVVVRRRGNGHRMHRLELWRMEGGRGRLVVLGAYEREVDAREARAVVRADPAAHWREPAKRGPKTAPVRWAVSVRALDSGRAQVTLERSAQGERRRSCSVATCDTRREAEVIAEQVRADAAPHWREPHAAEPRALESKRRARARQRPPEPVSIVPAGMPERLANGRWALACGLHESARELHVCPACARAHAATLAALDDGMIEQRKRMTARTTLAMTRRQEAHGTVAGEQVPGYRPPRTLAG